MPIDSTPKLAGILVPVFALRSNTDLGVGDTECVRQMVDWCAAHRFSVLQLLPINETGDDNSPYNAISAMALDPTTIAISPSSLPDLPRATFERLAAPERLRELRRGPVAYRRVKPLKLELLRAAFDHFLKEHDATDSPRAREFRAFVQSHAEWVADYALFRTLMLQHQNLPVWEEWPAEHQSPSRARSWMLSRPSAERDELDRHVLFFTYVQWIAHTQWSELKRHAGQRGVMLMGDIPYGIGRCSADVWSQRTFFDLGWSCGAPPETFFKPDLFTEKWGQNWGVPLYRWDWMEADQHSWWRARVRVASETCHLFRIDHVLGFYRIYAFPWKPQDNGQYVNLTKEEAKARAGALPRFWPNEDDTETHQLANCAHGEKLLRMVIEAAGETGVVAEDLGMVPNYVRPSLLKMGVPGFKIPIFERHEDGTYQDSGQYTPLSVATLATHDHEPIAAFWKRWATAKEGPAERSHLLNWIGMKLDPPPAELTPELHAAVCRKLLQCPSWLVVFMITDLFGQTARFNVPGPSSDSNWTERLPVPVSEFDHRPEYADRVRAVEQGLPRT